MRKITFQQMVELPPGTKVLYKVPCFAKEPKRWIMTRESKDKESWGKRLIDYRGLHWTGNLYPIFIEDDDDYVVW